VIIVIVLRDHNPLGSGELLFQVRGDGLLLLPSEGSSALTCPCLVQGLACGNDESLLLSMRGSGGDLSRSHGILLLPLSGDNGCGGDDGMVPIDGIKVGVAARHGRQDGGGGSRWALGLDQRWAEAKKKLMALITMLERGMPPKIRCIALRYWYIYIGMPLCNPREGGCAGADDLIA
jgi:hypothetical protein